jgi:hypothetical protein
MWNADRFRWRLFLIGVSLRSIVLAFVIGALVSCSRHNTGQAPSSLDSALLSELRQRVTLDQAARERFTLALRSGHAPDTSVVAGMIAVDAANTAWLRGVVARQGWPTRSAVGEDGVSAAFLLVQHADRDTSFQSLVLPMLERAYRRGEVEGQDVAMLTDRLAGARHQPQVYGTQADVLNGRVVLKPIIDSANVDARRAAMGLPSMTVYLRALDSVYLGRSRP